MFDRTVLNEGHKDNVVECRSTIKTIEGIFSVYKKHTLSNGELIDPPRGMNGCFTPSHLSRTGLKGPATDSMSVDKIQKIAFEMMHPGTSPMSMGRTPGHLSKRIRQQATNADIDMGSVKDVHM